MRYATNPTMLDALAWYQNKHCISYGRLMASTTEHERQLIYTAYCAELKREKEKAKAEAAARKHGKTAVKFNPYNGQPISE